MITTRECSPRSNSTLWMTNLPFPHNEANGVPLARASRQVDHMHARDHPFHRLHCQVGFQPYAFTRVSEKPIYIANAPSPPHASPSSRITHRPMMEDLTAFLYAAVVIVLGTSFVRWRFSPVCLLCTLSSQVLLICYMQLYDMPTLGGPSLPLLSYLGAVNILFRGKTIVNKGYRKVKSLDRCQGYVTS